MFKYSTIGISLNIIASEVKFLYLYIVLAINLYYKAKERHRAFF